MGKNPILGTKKAAQFRAAFFHLEAGNGTRTRDILLGNIRVTCLRLHCFRSWQPAHKSTKRQYSLVLRLTSISA